MTKTSTPRAPRTSKRVQKAQSNQATAQALRDEMVSIIGRRTQALRDDGKHVATEWARIVKSVNNEGFVNALAIVQGNISFGEVLRVLPHHDSDKGARVNYVQAKTVEKIVNITQALAGGTSDKLSDYVAQGLHGALTNGGALSLQGLQAALSRRVACPDNETLTSRAGYTPGTASSQASQVREALRLMGLADTIKGKRNDIMQVRAEAMPKLRELFAMGETETETE